MQLPVKIPGRDSDVSDEQETGRLRFRLAGKSAHEYSWPNKLCKAESFTIDRSNSVDKDFAHKSGNGAWVICAFKSYCWEGQDTIVVISEGCQEVVSKGPASSVSVVDGFPVDDNLHAVKW